MTYTIPVYLGDERETGTAAAPSGVQPVAVQRIMGAARIQTGARTIGTDVVRVLGASPARRTVTIQNTGSNAVYIGGEDVSVAQGYQLAAAGALTIELAGELYAVAAAAGESVRWLTELDA